MRNLLYSIERSPTVTIAKPTDNISICFMAYFRLGDRTSRGVGWANSDTFMSIYPA
ncbi:hypothetical protein [Nostoc sp.]|uniref:hypothetical protein n=1 Tax=Nostoc sp. TaxID=1180 RepID=UPI002FFC4F91